MAKAEIIKRPVEQVGDDIKKSAWAAVIESLALVIIGILFLVFQDSMLKVLAYIVGLFFIIKGGFQIITYFMEKGQNDFFNNGLLSGVVGILIGITALAIGEDIANIFRIVIGVLIIYESLVRINLALKLASAKIDNWKYILILALCIMAIGIFVTFNKGAVITLVGWMMILTGILGVVGDTMFIQHVNSIVDKITKKS